MSFKLKLKFVTFHENSRSSDPYVFSSLQDKANMHFHKLFLDVPTEEPLKQSKC